MCTPDLVCTPTAMVVLTTKDSRVSKWIIHVDLHHNLQGSAIKFDKPPANYLAVWYTIITIFLHTWQCCHVTSTGVSYSKYYFISNAFNELGNMISSEFNWTYIEKTTVTLLALLHVKVTTAWATQELLRLRHIKEAHPAAMEQAEGEVCGTAATEQLAWH